MVVVHAEHLELAKLRIGLVEESHAVPREPTRRMMRRRRIRERTPSRRSTRVIRVRSPSRRMRMRVIRSRGRRTPPRGWRRPGEGAAIGTRRPTRGDARADENVRGGSVEFGGVDPVRSHGRGHLLGERPAPLGEGGRGVVLGRGVRVIDGGMFEGDGGGGLAEERVGGDARQAEHRERGESSDRASTPWVSKALATPRASERASSSSPSDSDPAPPPAALVRSTGHPETNMRASRSDRGDAGAPGGARRGRRPRRAPRRACDWTRRAQ